MTESTLATPAPEQSGQSLGAAAGTGTSRRREGGLNGMLLPELKKIAASLGIKGAGAMRKSQLVEAIKAVQRGSSPTRPSDAPASRDGNAAAHAAADAGIILR